MYISNVQVNKNDVYETVGKKENVFIVSSSVDELELHLHRVGCTELAEEGPLKSLPRKWIKQKTVESKKMGETGMLRNCQ